MPSILNASSDSKQSNGLNAPNGTSVTLSTSSKIDCAKECPCGGPAIPVPDQWLEVMVTGGFKVWHIIFIIIALIVTLVVVYCCFHRCRIPRTKQEIEADLMRTNMTNKFRDYLQELPNEQITFTSALKKVQEMEEKVEQDDALYSKDTGARSKRMGWLKLKGKDKANPEGPVEPEMSLKGETKSETEPPAAASEDLATGKQPLVVEADKAKPDTGPVELQPGQAEEDKTGDKQQADQEQLQKSKQLKPRRKPKPNLSRTKVARKSSSNLEAPTDLVAPVDASPPVEIVTKIENGPQSSHLELPPVTLVGHQTDRHHRSKHHHGHRARSASKTKDEAKPPPLANREKAKQTLDKDNNTAPHL